MNNQIPNGLFGLNLPPVNVEPEQAAPVGNAAAGQNSPVTPPPPQPQAPMAAAAAHMAAGLNPFAGGLHPLVPQWPAQAGLPYMPPLPMPLAYVPPQPGFLNAALHAHVMGAPPFSPPSPPARPQFGIWGQVGARRNMLPAFDASSLQSAKSDQTQVQASPPSVCKPGMPTRRRDDGFDDGSPNNRPRQQVRV